MDITTFFNSIRQEGLLVGDYNAYRSMCSRRLATLRKRLGRANTKKYSTPSPLTPADIAKDASHVQLLLFAAERAWAHGMHLKSLISEDPSAAIGSTKSHIVSRFHKAQKHAFELCKLLESAESNATGNDLLEATAYAYTLRGLESFEKKTWEAALRAFAVPQIIYATLTGATKKEVYQEQLTSTVDPSIRYSAYQLQLPRSMDIEAISRQYFSRADLSRVAEELEKVDPQVFADRMEVEATEAGTVTSVTWRGRTAPVEVADISIALYEAHAAESAYNSHDQHGSTDAFDAVLQAWQDAVDATRKTIDERQAEGMSNADPKMQHLLLTWTTVNYAMICWRVGRNRVMISSIKSRPKKAGKDGQAEVKEVSAKKISHLKEEIALCDAILQSLEQVSNLPGVAADKSFSAELNAKTHYFRSLRLSSIAHSHAFLHNLKNALALFHHAHQSLNSALPSLPSQPSEPSHKGLEVTPSEAHSLQQLLAAEVTRYRALVEMENIAAKPSAGKQYGVLLDRLDQWPESVDFENGIVQWPPKVQPVPVKPMFLDIAWNFVEYPGVNEARQKQQVERNEAEEKRGLLGRLWGR